MTLPRDFHPDDWEDVRARVLQRATEREWLAVDLDEHRRRPSPNVLTQWLAGRIGVEAPETRPCCEWCGRPNGVRVPIYPGGSWQRLTVDADLIEVWSARGEVLDVIDLSTGYRWSAYQEEGWEPTTTVLTCAHLDQDPTQGDPARIRALCQRCHLTYDARPDQRVRRETILAELYGQERLPGL